MKKTEAMISVEPTNEILGFAFPLILGNVFQQLYTFIDTIIVGKMIGLEALAAVGTTEWISFLMFGMIQGTTQGFSVYIAQKFGAADYKLMRKGIINSFYLSAICSIIFLTIGQGLLGVVLKMLKTPDTILEIAMCYLSVLYYGIPISFMYNLLASILRALGNSHTPLMAITISSGVNIVLDYLFVIWFNAGVFGVALGTVLAQLIATIICIYKLKGYIVLRFESDERLFSKDICKEQLRLGIPMGLQNIITSIGGLVVQTVVNSFGVVFIAAHTAATKLYGLLETAASSYGYAVSTFVGQNYGAKRLGRVRQGMISASAIGVISALFMSAIMILEGYKILMLFISGNVENVRDALLIGSEYLKILAMFFPLLYLLYIWRACIQGMGNTFLPMLSSVLQLIMRVFCALILTQYVGNQGIFWGEVLAWVAADVFLLICYIQIINSKVMVTE